MVRQCPYCKVARTVYMKDTCAVYVPSSTNYPFSMEINHLHLVLPWQHVRILSDVVRFSCLCSFWLMLQRGFSSPSSKRAASSYWLCRDFNWLVIIPKTKWYEAKSLKSRVFSILPFVASPVFVSQVFARVLMFSQHFFIASCFSGKFLKPIRIVCNFLPHSFLPVYSWVVRFIALRNFCFFLN